VKKIIFTITALLHGAFLFSQVSIGPKMGLAISNLFQDDTRYYNSYVIGSSPYYGFQAGLSLIFETDRTFRPQIELFYFQEGNNYELKHYVGDNHYDFYNLRQNRRYIKANFVFNIGRSWAKHPNFRFYGSPGFSYGYLIASDTELESQTQKAYSYNIDHYNNLVNTNIALFVGFSTGIKIGPGWLELTPRFQVSLVPYRYEYGYPFDIPNFSSNISFSVGYTYLIKPN